jgi:tetratricopeptide (TPR) repeat protein
MPIAIDELLAGKAVDLVLKGVRGAVRAFGEQDSVGRLLVLLHADFGIEADLDRDVFYAWRKRSQLIDVFEAVIVGELLEDDTGVQGLTDLIQPRLVRTPRDDRPELARRMAVAVFRAAPIVIDGATPETRLLLAHIDAARSEPHGSNAVDPRRVRFHLPLVVTHFTGRDDELAMLDGYQDQSQQGAALQAIIGLGGVGKSQLAARYVHAHVDDYDVVAWIRAEEGAIADLARLADELGQTRADMTVEARAEAAIAWLTSCGERWLLVLDNLSDAAQLEVCCPSSGNGRVLITTRDQSVGQYAWVLTVDVFDEAQAVDYLLRRTGRVRDRAGAERVARALGCLPLALAHAGAYCAQGTTLDEYLRLLDGLPARELFTSSREAFYRETVASTWQASIKAASSQAPLAPDMLGMASYLGPDDIPRAFFDALIDRDDLRQRKALIDAAAALHRFSLATVTPATIALHRLVQHVVRESTTCDSARLQQAAVAVLSTALPDDPERPDDWPAYEALAPHILAFGEAYRTAPDLDGDVLSLLNHACLYLSSVGADRRIVDAASVFARRARELLGDEHPDTLIARASLAAAYRQAGRVTSAIAIEEDLASDFERLLGDQHPHTLAARSNLAYSYSLAGRIADTTPMFERVLADSQRLVGDQHRDTLTARSNLAYSYSRAGRTAEAIAMFERVVADSARLLGDEHPHALTARANLACSYSEAGRTAEAIAIDERLVADRERLLGVEHPDTLIARINLAVAYRDAGRTADAIAIEERLVVDSERVLGDEHPNTLTARANLAASYWQAGRTLDAIAIEERVLADRERLLGDKHPDTLKARCNLAASYRQAGRTTDAIAIDELVVADTARLLGDQHPDTLIARGHLANSYWQAGQYSEAIALDERLVTDSERRLGDEHPNTLTARANLAASYWNVGRIAEAITMLERVVVDRERLLGGQHPETLIARANLADAYGCLSES